MQNNGTYVRWVWAVEIPEDRFEQTCNTGFGTMYCKQLLYVTHELVRSCYAAIGCKSCKIGKVDSGWLNDIFEQQFFAEMNLMYRDGLFGDKKSLRQTVRIVSA